MKVVFSVDGLKALEGALKQLPSRTSKAAVKRAGMDALETTMAKARELVPVGKEPKNRRLRDGIVVGQKLSKRQARLNKAYGRMMANGRNAGKMNIEVFGGSTMSPHAHLVEFGTSHSAAKPFMRPAWESTKDQVLDDFKNKLWIEIRKAALRVSRKNARLAAKAAKGVA